jgi:hypothetical protein
MTDVAQVVDRHAAHVHAHMPGSMGTKTSGTRVSVLKIRKLMDKK